MDQGQGRVICDLVTPYVDIQQGRGIDSPQTKQSLLADLAGRGHDSFLVRLELTRDRYPFDGRFRQGGWAVTITESGSLCAIR